MNYSVDEVKLAQTLYHPLSVPWQLCQDLLFAHTKARSAQETLTSCPVEAPEINGAILDLMEITCSRKMATIKHDLGEATNG